MSSYRRQNMSSLIEIHNKHCLPSPLIKSAVSETWALCVSGKITPTQHSLHGDAWEDVEAGMRQTGIDAFWLTCARQKVMFLRGIVTV